MKRSDSEGSSRPGLRCRGSGVREREGERVSVSVSVTAVTAGSCALHREPVDPAPSVSDAAPVRGHRGQAWPNVRSGSPTSGRCCGAGQRRVMGKGPVS